jgi:hypothetical protein
MQKEKLTMSISKLISSIVNCSLLIVHCSLLISFAFFTPAFAVEQPPQSTSTNLSLQVVSREGDEGVVTKSGQAEYVQVVGAADTRTTFSDGRHPVEELVRMARERGIEVLIINDHDRYSLEYGIWPLHKIIKKKVDESSLLKNGAAAYLEEIERIGKKYPEVLIIPGVESAPFYYWTGSAFTNNLTAHKWENHIGIIGFERPEDFEGLPTLNSNFSLKYYKKYIYNIAFFGISFLLSGILILWKGMYRYAGISIAVLSLLLIVNFHPFQSSQFDQYHGDQGIAPWQETIDYANSRGGITIWHHMESASGIGKKGPISVNTPPHPEDLLKTYGYTAFQSIYEDTIHVTEPGREWDILLSQYCAGNRDAPVWGVGGHDFHGEGESGIKLQDVKTIFLLKKNSTSQGGVEKTKQAIYEAIINGKFYPLRQGQTEDYRLVLDEFSILDSSGIKAVSGDVIEVKGNPQISVKVSVTPPLPPFDKGGARGELVEVQLIRKGEVIQKFSGETPLEINFNDDLNPLSPPFTTSPSPPSEGGDKGEVKGGKGGLQEGEMISYRLSVHGKRPNYIMSNPIFVKLLPAPSPQSSPQGGEETGGGQTSPSAKEEASTSTPSPSEGEGQGEGEKREAKAPQYIIIEKVSAVRSGPGVEYEKIGRVDKGERLEIISIEEKLFKGKPWYKVRYKLPPLSLLSSTSSGQPLTKEWKGEVEGFVWGGLARKE